MCIWDSIGLCKMKYSTNKFQFPIVKGLNCEETTSDSNNRDSRSNNAKFKLNQESF